jgi:diguanylate cyclase (GGDEF)-like protein
VDQTGPGGTTGTGALWRDPVLVGLLGYVGVASVFFLSEFGSVETRITVLWLLQIPLDAALAVFSWRVRSISGITRTARRFWTTLSLGAALISVGDTVHTVMVFRDPRPEYVGGGPVQSVTFVIAIGAITAVMLTYAPGTGRGRERLRWWLDSVTVLVGGGVLAWWLAFGTDLAGTGDDRTEGMLAVLGGACAVLITLFAAVRMVLSRAAPVTQVAAAPLLAAVFLQCVAVFVVPVEPGEAISPAAFLIRVVPSIIAVAGPVLQHRQASRDPGVFATRPARQFSALPYTAVALTSMALIASLPTKAGPGLWGVVVGTVGTITLVVARQLLTLRELSEHEGRLVEQASHDALTRLLNRAGLAERAGDLLAGDRQPGMALLLIDLDDFKTINDTLGHGAGDRLLVTVASRLRQAVGPADLVARLGGDEFAVLLHSGSDVERIAHRILDAVCTPVTIGEQTLLVGASIGAADARPDDDLASLLRHADIALYEGKDRGKGTAVRYAPEMRTRLVETAEMGARLRDAIDAGEMRLVYQPIVRIDDGRIVGAEALVRWVRPDGTVVPPIEFIPVAERTGLIVPLGRWVLREACREAAGWVDAHRPDAPMSMNVNVAGRQLQESGFVDEVADALASAGLFAGRLTLEITETAALAGPEVMRTLHELRALGVRLALDDFGTAASSLGLLLTCPVTSLKLDRSFVEGITTVTRQKAVATAVVQIAQALDLDVVAEGVETPEQADLLRELGYRHAQGFLYHRPQPPEQLAAVFRGATRPLPAGLPS